MKKLNPDTTTVIDDGMVRYPVASAKLADWEEINGKVTAKNYDQFCNDVDHLMPGVNVGSSEMIIQCERLIEGGADFYSPQP